MKKKHIHILLFGLIIGLSAILRFWQLGNVPVSPDWDEVSLGYNAYSLLKTGKDEFGELLPIVLKSFGDYKPALYAYLAIPFVTIFDLNILAVRFPSALFGTLSVIATFFLVKELFKRIDIAFLSAFLLAISPWHIQFSRVAFEANIGVACNIFTALFFLKGLKKPIFLFLSVFFAAASLYVYQSEKLFMPLFALTLLFIYKKELFHISKNYLISAVLFGIVLCLPLLFYASTNEGFFARAQGTSFLSRQQELTDRYAKRLTYDTADSNIVGRLVNNRRVVYAKTFIEGYISHFDLNWLFLTGDIARHHAPGMGLLYLLELPFLLIGIYSLGFSKLSGSVSKARTFIFAWLLLSPLPAALTNDVPHAVRTLNFLPTFQILSAYGVVTAIRFLQSKTNRVVRNGIFILLIFIALWNFVYYINQYFVQQNYFYANEWQYGYEKLMPLIEKNKAKYDAVVVSNITPLDQSYMFFLFYLRYPPADVQKVSAQKAFDTFEFRPIIWGEDMKKKNTLYIGSPKEFPLDIKTLDEIKYPNGEVAIKVVET